MIEHNKIRGETVYRRTYSRPNNEEGTKFEEWDDTIARVIKHQQWLWERAKGSRLDETEFTELEGLKVLLLSRKCSLSGRTLWLGGTETAKKREASQFNCAGLTLKTINDVVDQIWLLMQGCGTGFHPEVGILNGFTKKINNIEVIRSELKDTLQDVDRNIESYSDGVWTIKVGDSAEAWAKTFGKLLAGKYAADKLIFDFSNIRPAGERLKGYGWISSGDTSMAVALPAIAEILNKQAGQLLTRIDLLDIGNWMGTVLSSRRSAEIAFHRFGDPEWEDFAKAKMNIQEDGNVQRYQSNNSLLFYQKPSKLELRGIFEMMVEAGGSEPGFINAEEALRRAAWFRLLNPCAEILLGDSSFCNLVETNLSAFNGDEKALHEAIYLIGRANYRQTCVNLKDGILQDTWHELNEFLRLTGMGVTGIVDWEYCGEAEKWQQLRLRAQESVNSMASDLGLPRSKAVTTVKPSGTLSKMMGCKEGIHQSMGKYIFNNIIFSISDPLVQKLVDANYATVEHPNDPQSVIVTFPVLWEGEGFKTVVKKGLKLEINTDSAIVQLERYKMVMENYVDHNCSITVSYSVEEIPEIVNWLFDNWACYVGVSWLFRVDPTITAEEIGYPYLPQEVKTKDEWYAYANSLESFSFKNTETLEELDGTEECVGGVCPVR